MTNGNNPTCLNCQATDQWVSIEEILGTAGLNVNYNGEIEFDGHTDIQWDTSESVAIFCMECDTTYDFKSFPKALVKIDFQRRYAANIKCCCDQDNHWVDGEHIGAADNHLYHRTKDH